MGESDVWEYKVLYHIDQEALNALGKQGWEVVGIAGVGAGINVGERCVLKRRAGRDGDG